MFKAKAAKASHSDVACRMIDIALGAHPVRYNLFLPCVSDIVFFSESSWISCPGPQSQTSSQPDASNKENVDVDGCCCCCCRLTMDHGETNKVELKAVHPVFNFGTKLPPRQP